MLVRKKESSSGLGDLRNNKYDLIVAKQPFKLTQPIYHECSQVDKIQAMENTINELYQVITGKGEPGKGLISQMIVMNSIQERTVDTLGRIEINLTKFDQKAMDADRKITEVKIDLDIYKAEGRKFREGRVFAEGNRNSIKTTAWQRAGIIIAAIALLATLSVSIINFNSTRNKSTVTTITTDKK